MAGYHWLNYLSEVGWGGILADDMGLGKTVQALSFLQFYKETHGSLKALVVCPTTLMFNWENEIKKPTFSSGFTYNKMAQMAGLEPATKRLTVACSTN